MSDEPQSLTHVVRRARRGDLDAFTDLVRRFQDMAVGYAFSVLGDFQRAEEAAQDAFVQVLQDLPGLREPAAFPSWLRRIIFKHCNRQTRVARLSTTSIEGLEEIMADRKTPAPDDELLRAEFAAAVHRVVAALPEHQRQTVTLFYMGQHAQSEVAAFLDISEGAVRKRLHDTRKALKETMLTMVEDSLQSAAPSRDDRFEKQVLRSAMPLQVFVVEPEPTSDRLWGAAESNLGSTVGGRGVDLPEDAVWFVEPRLDVGADDDAFEQLLDEMKQRRIPGLRTGGRLSDRHLPRLAELADHLVYLDLCGGNTGITDAGLRHLASLPRLRYLNVNLNGPCNSPTLIPAEVTDAGLQVLAHLPDLEELKLDNLFRIGDATMRHLQAMPHLRELSLHGTRVTDVGLAHLSGLAQLEAVSLPTLATDVTPLRELPSFTDVANPRARLNMGKSPLVGDAGLRTVGELHGLAHLQLCESRLLRDRWVGFLDDDLPWVPAYTGNGIEPLAALPHLQELGMSGDRQDDDALIHLGQFPTLQELGCARPAAGDRGWQGLARSRSLRRIGAFEAPGLTGAGVAALATMPQLADVGLGGPNVHDDDLAPLADMPSLRAFTAERGNVFTDKAYAHIGRIQQLERLSTGRARTIDDAATAHIARLPQLASLHLSGGKMTDHTCELLADAPALQDLSLRVRRLTDAGPVHLNRCRRLKTLKMDDCPLVTMEGVDALRDDIELDWQPATVRNLIEAAIEDDTVRDQAVAALAARGREARHELEVFRDIVAPDLKSVFQGLIDRM